jgi:hypothetical protein
MCANQKCPYEYGVSIYETQKTAVDLLWMFELTHFGREFELENFLSADDENRLVDAVFPFRHLCWECARSRIENAMHWRFSWLDLGVWLTEHAALLKIVDDLQPISDEWIDFFILNSVNEWVCEYAVEDFVLKIKEFELGGIQAEQVIDICSWFKRWFDEPIELAHLSDVIGAGYMNSEYLSSLDSDEVYDFIKWGVIPPLRILVSLGGQLDEFLQMRAIFWDDLREDDDPCEFIERLIHLEINIDLLRALSDNLVDDEEMEVVVDELDDELQDFSNRSFTNQFLDSIMQVKNAGFEVSRENLIRYWGLSSDLIFYVVDNDLLSRDELKIARLVEKPLELASWLETGFELIPHDSVRNWLKFGFSANDAHEWCRSGFDAETANLWRHVTVEPVAARRRIEAGIQPPEIDV